MDQFTLAEFAKNSENKEGAEFTPAVQENGIEQGTLIVSRLYNTMLGEVTKYLRSINAELINVLDEAGVTPSALSDEQLYTAIKKIVGQSHGRNVGDVYFSYSSSATDNVGALPLFTGELISNADNLYPQFYAWLDSHPEICTTEAAWQSAIGVYGECPMYVLNTSARTIRLPLLKNYIKIANTVDGITQAKAGLPNITGNFYASGDYILNSLSASGAFKQGPNVSRRDPHQADVHSYPSIDFDASNSNAIYGNSNTVTPAYTTLYPWVCVYNEATPASMVQAAEFQEALSSKADVDFNNLTSMGTASIAKWALPSAVYDNLALGANGAEYTAPANGYAFLSAQSSINDGLIQITAAGGYNVSNRSYGRHMISVLLPITADKKFWVYYDGTLSNVDFKFIYAEGSIPEGR